jgi:beta-phosphoglucomutase-like phosphatase (HAD superfamily)
VFATLLDFDGLLVDSEPVHLAAFNDVLAEHHIAITAKEYAERYMSHDDAGVFRNVLARAGRTLVEEEVRALVAAKSPRFLARFAERFRVFPGAPELIERRARRGVVGIVSGALEQEIEFALDRMGTRHLVDLIVAAGRALASKPDPAPYHFAMKELRALGHVEGAVAVEDALGGVLSAKNAGLRCVAVTHSYGRDQLLRVGADAVVDDLKSLTDEVLEG